MEVWFVSLGSWSSFHIKLLNALYAFLFNFFFSRSTFRFYSICLIVSVMLEIWDEKYKKLRNCLSKMTSWIKLFLKKVSLLQQKGTLFDKMTLVLSRWEDGGRIHPNWKLFFQKWHFLFRSRTLYLPRIGPDNIEIINVALLGFCMYCRNTL